jgi:hypothetical protein
MIRKTAPLELIAIIGQSRMRAYFLNSKELERPVGKIFTHFNRSALYSYIEILFFGESFVWPNILTNSQEPA